MKIPADFKRVVLSCDRCVVSGQHLTAAASFRPCATFFNIGSFKPGAPNLKKKNTLSSLQSPPRSAPTCHRSGSPGRRGAGL